MEMAFFLSSYHRHDVRVAEAMTAATREYIDLAGLMGSASGAPVEDCGASGKAPGDGRITGGALKTAIVAEQWIDDPVSGLRIGIQVYDDADIGVKLILIRTGDEILPFGNREIFFDADGKECGGGMYLGNVCAMNPPTPRTEIGET